MLAKSRALLLPFSFLLFAGASFAQITAIEGTVKGADGQPVKDAQILIERKDMKGTYKGAKTDKKGHYLYNGLPKGSFKVSAVVDGQVKQFVDNVQTKLGDPTPVDITIGGETAGAGPAPGPEIERGLSAKDKEALDKKKKENEAAIAKNKALNDAFNAGKEALLAKNYDAAVEAFTKATEIDAAQPVIWANLAESQADLAGSKTGADQQAAMDKSLQAYGKAIELKADDPAYHNNYALALAKSKKYPEAQGELEKAAQLDPANAGKYFYNLGAVYVNTGQTDAAGEAFKKAVEANPNYADAQYQYGVFLISKATTTPEGKIVPPAGTVEALQKYLELSPTGPFADSAKGILSTIEGGVQTSYSNPSAPKPSTPAKKR